MVVGERTRSRDARVGVAVRRLRGDRTQADVAGQMREHGHLTWSQSTVWSIEKGDRPLRLTEAVTLAQLLETQVSEFVDTYPDLSEELATAHRALETSLVAMRGEIQRVIRARDVLCELLHDSGDADNEIVRTSRKDAEVSIEQLLAGELERARSDRSSIARD